MTPSQIQAIGAYLYSQRPKEITVTTHNAVYRGVFGAVVGGDNDLLKMTVNGPGGDTRTLWIPAESIDTISYVDAPT